jgi:hypothetical protein
MNTIRDLSILIFGLSKREKTEFEQYANRQGSDQKYMQVYRVLDKMILTAKSADLIPDEEALAKRVRLELKDGNTAAYSTYLFKMILRSLRSNNDSDKKEDDILQNINNAKILVRRGLFESAIDSLETALADANLYEYHALAVQALRELVYLEGQKDSKSYADNIKDRLEKIIQLSTRQALESNYFSMHHRAFLLSRSRRPVTHGEAEQEFAALRSHPMLSETSAGPTFFSQVYYWQAKASIANIEGKVEEALLCSKEIVLLWQSKKYEHLQEEHPRRYIIHLHNFVSFAIGCKHFEEAEEFLNTMELFPCTNFDDAAEKFQNVLMSRQLLLLNTDRYREAITAVSEKLKEIEGRYRDKINTARLIALYYNTLAACFVLKEYEAAQDWSDRIYKIGRTEQRRDIQFINKVFQIIIRFELGRLHLLDNEIKNTTQNLRDHGQLDQTNSVILHWLAKLIKNSLDNRDTKGVETEKAIFTGFREALLAEKETNANRQVIGLEEVLMWVEGKVI